jgi:hypothetical protein
MAGVDGYGEGPNPGSRAGGPVEGATAGANLEACEVAPWRV